MKIIKKNTLNTKELTAAKELEALCRNTDNLIGSLFLSPELNYDESLPCFFLLYEGNMLSAFLSIFMPSEDEAQISVCTHPCRRHLGFCTKLLSEAAKVLEDYDIYDMIFLIEPNAKAFLSLLDKLNAKLLNSEYLMTYNNVDTEHAAADATCDTETGSTGTYELIPAASQSLENHITLHHRAFETDYDESESFVSELFNDESIKVYAFLDKASGKIIGSCYMDISASQLIILGVCIEPDMQDAGLGRLMMTELITKYALPYNKPISLQVSGTNTAAVHLYKKLGFTITSQFDYHVVDCENIL